MTRNMWVLAALAALTVAAVIDMSTGSGFGGILIEFFETLIIDFG